MRKLNIRQFVFPVLIMLGFGGFMTAAYGEGNGGAVSTKGQITLITEETTVPTVDSTVQSTTQSTTDSTIVSSYPKTSGTVVESSSVSPIITKPQGKYPSTGELVKTSLSISGAALLLIALFLFLWKRKKDQAAQEEGKQ